VRLLPLRLLMLAIASHGIPPSPVYVPLFLMFKMSPPSLLSRLDLSRKVAITIALSARLRCGGEPLILRNRDMCLLLLFNRGGESQITPCPWFFLFLVSLFFSSLQPTSYSALFFSLACPPQSPPRSARRFCGHLKFSGRFMDSPMFFSFINSFCTERFT